MTIVDCVYWPVIYVRLNLWNKGLNPVFRFTMCISVKLTDVRGVCGTPFSELASPISSTNKILSSSLNMNNLTCRYTTLISHNARFDFYTFEFQILHHTRVVFPITFAELVSSPNSSEDNNSIYFKGEFISISINLQVFLEYEPHIFQLPVFCQESLAGWV